MENTSIQKTVAVDKMAVEFVPMGAKDKIRLTAAMVRQYIAVPTKSGKLPTERDCIRFLMLCKGKEANPFEGDVYLIGYDNAPPKEPSFSLVCGIELFLKRAEQSADYDGNEYGVIVEKPDGEIEKRMGTVTRKKETILGGWAKVYRKNRSIPTFKSVNLSVYDTGQSRWAKDPAGQIAKVALSQALREAYTTAIGGLYTREEMQRVSEIDGTSVPATGRVAIAMPEEIVDSVPAIDTKISTHDAEILKKMEEIIVGSGEMVTEWAVGTKKIDAGRTWRDMSDAQMSGIIKIGGPSFMATVNNYFDSLNRS